VPKGVHLPRRIVVCQTCATSFSCEGSRVDAKFCSRKCLNEARRSLPFAERKCIGCQKPFVPRSKDNATYCSRGCWSVVKSQNHKKQGIFSNYKHAKALLMQDTKACSKCGWDKEVGILELHHIDRNTKNNHISNLQVLCPNCHSLDHFYAKDGQFKNNLGVVRLDL
jgi:peptide methionine sulfoxide reductase MsrB